MKFKHLFKGLMALTVLGLQFCAQGQGEKKVLDAKSFSEALAKTPDALVLDVRTPEEFAGGHLGNAVNVDWNGDGFDSWSKKIDKEARDMSPLKAIRSRVGARILPDLLDAVIEKFEDDKDLEKEALLFTPSRAPFNNKRK